MSHPKVLQLAKVLTGFDMTSTVALAAGMCTVPRFQANSYRLELFIHVALGACRGKKKPGWQQLETWLNYFVGDMSIAVLEDWVEDAFVLNVLTKSGDFRVLGGAWEAGESASSLLIDAVTRLSLDDKREWLGPAVALLRLSDAVAERAGLRRWHSEKSIPKKALQITSKTPLEEWRRRVTFSSAELSALGILERDLECFVYDASKCAELLSQSNQESDLHRFPVLRFRDLYVLALPPAVTYAVRRHLVSCAAERGKLDILNGAVMHRVFARLQDTIRFGHRHRVTNLELPLEVRGVEGWCASVVLRVGQRRFLHFIVVSFGLGQIASSGYLKPNSLSELREEQLAAHIKKVREYIERTEDVDSGHSFLLAGHLGEAVISELPEERDRWTFSLASLSDLEMLFRDPANAANRLILLLNQEAALAKQGVEIPFQNGLLNFYAFWSQNGFVLRIPEMPHDARGLLQIPLDSVARYRINRRTLVNEHCVRFPMGGYTTVQRGNGDSIFGTRKELAAHVSMDLIEQGVLAFCIPHGNGLFWVLVQPSNDPRQDDAVFDLWEGLQLFAARALELLNSPLELVAPVVGIHIDCSAVLPRGRPEAERSFETALHTHLAPGVWTAEIRAEPGFLHNFEGPENSGEQYLISEFLRALGLVSRGELTGKSDYREMARRVLGGTGARILHSLRVHTQVEALLAFDKRPVYREPVEHMESSMGTAFTWMSAPKEIVQLDVATSKERLNQAVQVKAHALAAHLRVFGRVGLISELLHLNETLLRNAQRWKTTARAVRGLYGVEDGTRAAAEAEQTRAQLQIVMRALVEAATCECSDDGRTPDQYSIDELVGEMTSLINFGRDSDVLYYGLSTDGIRQFPNGAYSLNADVIGELSTPFYKATFGQGYSSAADDYDDLVRNEPVPVSDLSNSIFYGAALGAAWLAEYGLTFESFRQIFGELMDLGCKRGSVVVKASAAEVAEARASGGVTKEDVDAFLRAFGLPRRPGWLAREGVDKPKDINPWKFERRLSVSLRPLVLLDDSLQVFCYGVGTCREALLYVLDSVSNASFDKDVFQSPEMRSWLGGQTRKLGTDFSEEVGAMLSAAGWTVRVEIKPTELGAPKNPNLGDIDVFAWRPDGRVLQIECKRLKPSRTIAEIAQTCRRFKGNADDLLDRHLRRANWLRENLAKIAKFMKMDIASLVVRHPLVVSRPVPFGYLSGLPVPASDIVVVDLLLEYVDDAVAWDACTKNPTTSAEEEAELR